MASVLERRWSKAVLQWSDRLWLNEWGINVDVEDDVEQSTGNDGGFFPAAAITMAESRYKIARIVGSKSVLAQIEPKQFDEIACHEVVHIAQSPMDQFVDSLIMALPKQNRRILRDQWAEVNEGVTSHMQRVLSSLVKKKT